LKLHRGKWVSIAELRGGQGRGDGEKNYRMDPNELLLIRLNLCEDSTNVRPGLKAKGRQGFER